MRSASNRTAGSRHLRVAVTGLAVTYPYGGVFWDYVQYLLGLRQLGHDVLYVEDTGKWCYDPVARTFAERGDANAAHFDRQLRTLDAELANRWFFRDATDRMFGLAPEHVAEFFRSADLLIHLSACCILRPEYLKAARMAFVDSDPVYTQAGLMAGTPEEAAARLDYWTGTHDAFFTFGENVGHPSCLVPTAGMTWIPTRQPIVMSCFESHRRPPSDRRRVLTTVASWEPTEKGPIVNGIVYSGKSTEFLRFQNLPSRSAVPMEVAMSGPAPVESLRARGWQVVDAFDVTNDPWIYRDYLASSLAEWSVAKNAYVVSRSGWFSCRSACYLALGVPVIVQDTGFDRAIPIGEGIFTFRTPDAAEEAIRAVTADVERHSKVAIDIAREYFAADKVLPRLIERAMDGDGDDIAAAGLTDTCEASK